jgi:hypothetical protein
MGGRDMDGLFRGERNPPAGTRLGMPFRGAARKLQVTNMTVSSSPLSSSYKKICQLTRYFDIRPMANQVLNLKTQFFILISKKAVPIV